MTQKFLNRTEIGTAFQEVRGEAVPQGVRAYLACNRNLANAMADQ
jgi:hypothetical protein